ncbi:EscU/YscU/HrcU family type III secretion system export apparatus switch protein [Trinickia mobilis]|uniref:EscU/YscU/HrcU family type III secretion system export apparatus switch protein n=1 Tax=Trinickia mobilis TaxID=2816356 RepID=UPI001A8F82DF|nr:EscU/YscU/HrcU family type III secretion system export apparatus switch protein [Trinickia mobilis]
MSDKPLPPTLKRIHDARLEGQVPHSRDALSLVTLALVFEAVFAVAGYGRDRFAAVLGAALLHAANPAPGTAFALIGQDAIALFMMFSGTILGVAVLAVLAATWSTVGFVYAPKAFEQGIKRLNPAKYFQNLFSSKTLAELAMSFVKFGVIGAVVAVCVLHALPQLPLLAIATPDSAFDAMLSLTRSTVRAALAAMLLPTAIDVLLKRVLQLRSLRMGHDEVRREYKDTQGDPQIKSARRGLAMQWAAEDEQSKRLNANAVIANPEHFAVALRFVEHDTPVPLVVCRGADEAALELQMKARRDGIPVIRFPRLARALHAHGVDHDPIPPDTYAAVALVYHLIETMEETAGDDLDLSDLDDEGVFPDDSEPA